MAEAHGEKVARESSVNLATSKDLAWRMFWVVVRNNVFQEFHTTGETTFVVEPPVSVTPREFNAAVQAVKDDEWRIAKGYRAEQGAAVLVVRRHEVVPADEALEVAQMLLGAICDPAKDITLTQVLSEAPKWPTRQGMPWPPLTEKPFPWL